MKDLYEYISWRGDLDFKQAEFNNLDALVLSMLSYINFDNLLAKERQKNKISLRDAATFYQKPKDSEMEIHMIRENMNFFMAVSKTKRFGNLFLRHYSSETYVEKTLQFAAIEFLLNDGTVFISFRGTDDTLVGWMEDLNMGYLEIVPSQQRAVEYLERTQKYRLKKIRLGGHSKGGNLAVYSSAFVSKQIQARILNIYNFDGPGFHKSILESSGYKIIMPKIKTFVPETSIVGRLLWHQEDPLIIKSVEIGIFQHDPFSWKIKYMDFLYSEKLDTSSRILEEAVHNWLIKLEPEKRKEFVRTIFSLFEVNRIYSIKQFKSQKIQILKELMTTYNALPKHDKKMMQETINLLLNETKKSLTSNLRQKKV